MISTKPPTPDVVPVIDILNQPSPTSSITASQLGESLIVPSARSKEARGVERVLNDNCILVTSAGFTYTLIVDPSVSIDIDCRT